MKLQVLSLFLSASVADASWSKNINYRSPSEHHPSLGISIHRVVKRNNPSSSYEASSLNFTHGVASGDPFPTSVILWTRVAPQSDNSNSNVTVEGYAPLFDHDNEKYVSVSKSPICVAYKVASDKDLADVVDSGTVYTSSDVDFTVKVEAKNMKPYTTYYYQFAVCNSDNVSPVGRTKTTPNPDDDVTEIGLAVYSCANYPFGFFDSYGNVVRKDSVDYVVHLGDYIYEYKNGYYGWGDSINRIPLPNKEIFSLYDYRKRLATYRADTDLLASHQQFPWIDNVYRDGAAELRNDEDSFSSHEKISIDQRKMNAVRAYFEWMPIRQVDMDDNLRVWRSFSIGKLVDLVMLDTRNYDRSITDLYDNIDYIHAIANDGGRSLMGSRQENWMYRTLSESAKRGATWRVVGSQIVFSRISRNAVDGDGDGLNYDAWDGYLSNKNRTLHHLYSNNINNNIFLAGDSHASWVSDLIWQGEKEYDSVTGEGAIGVEFAGSAVSSPCPYGENITLSTANNYSNLIEGSNDELHWQDLYYRGYFELHITKDKVEANFFGIPVLREQNGWEIPLANFTVENGANKLQRPVGGGVVESGSLKFGERVQNNLTLDTHTGKWFES